MEPRTRSPAFVLPDAMKGIGSIIKAVGQGGITHELQEIVALRASRLNGCSACVHAHVQNLRKAGESEDFYNRLNFGVREPAGTSWG